MDYDGSNHPTRNKQWSASSGTTWDGSSQGAELYDGFISAAIAEAIAEDAAWYCWLGAEQLGLGLHHPPEARRAWGPCCRYPIEFPAEPGP